MTSLKSPVAAGAGDILDGLADAFFAVDGERRLTFLNKAAAALCNQPRQALVGRPLLAVLPEPLQNAMESALAAAAATGQRIRTTAAIASGDAPIEIDVQPAGGFAVFIRDAVAQSTLQRDLAERLERLRLAEQAAGAGIWDIDVRTDTVRGTPQFFLMMGLEPTDAAVPMRTLRDLRIAEDRSRVNRGYADAVDSGTDFYESEYRIRRGGETRWILGRGRVIRDASGKPVRYSGVDIDVTDRKNAELALEESEGRLKLAVEAADIGIWDWDVLAMTMTYSDRAKALYGFPLDRPVSYEQVRLATHPEDLPRTTRMARDALDPRVRLKGVIEYRIVRPDGEVRWMSAQGEATFATVEGVERGVRYTGTIQDITGRKSAEARLQRSETRLRLAMEAGRLGVWDYDVATDTVRGSPDLNRILGFPEDQPLDIDEVRRRYLPGEQERVRAAGEAALRSGETHFQVEFRFRRPDESVRWVQLRGEMTLDRRGRPQSAYGVLMDMSERKQAEEDRQFLVSELQHRTKNILSLVRAIAVQTFRKEGEADAVGVFTSRLVAMGAAHELPHQDNSESTDIGDIVRAALKPHRVADGRLQIGGPPVRLSPRQGMTLSLALNELTTNAIKYGALSLDSGRVEIGWSRETSEGDPTLRFSWKELGGPRVRAPSRRGFGTRLIEDHMAAEFGGTARLIYPATGLEFVLTAPWPQ